MFWLLSGHVIKSGPSLVWWRVERVRHNDNKPWTQSYIKANSAFAVKRRSIRESLPGSDRVWAEIGGYESRPVCSNERRTERNNEVKLAC